MLDSLAGKPLVEKELFEKQLQIRISIWQLLPESLRWTSRWQRASSGSESAEPVEHLLRGCH